MMIKIYDENFIPTKDDFHVSEVDERVVIRKPNQFEIYRREAS